MNYRDKTAKFVIKKNKKGEFYFNLVAENGEIVATSEGYKTRQGAYNGINAVRRCAVARVVEDTVGVEELKPKENPKPKKGKKPKKAKAPEEPKERKAKEPTQTLKDLLKLNRTELDNIATPLGLDAKSFDNKTKIAHAILQKRAEA